MKTHCVNYSNYQELNDNLISTVINEYFIKDWQSNKPKSSLEIIFSPKCNLKCEYCYIKNNNENIYTQHFPFDGDKAIKNTILLLTWLRKQKAHPSLEIFSGELFAQESGFKLLKTILTFYQEEPQDRPAYITIPTNGTFIQNQLLYNKIIAIQQEFKKINIDVYFSISTDGYYADAITRKYKTDLDIPLSDTYVLNQDFYEKLFQFMVDSNSLPHPMISPENIHVWKNNFLWFKEMLLKYGFSLDDLYLLEVRNYNWTTEKLLLFQDFISFLMDQLFELANHDPDTLIGKLTSSDIHSGGFNILSANFKRYDSDAFSCTLAENLMIKISDLTIYPCHRLLYPELKFGHFIIDDQNDEITEIIADNTEIGITILGMKPSKQHICNSCLLNTMCIHGCLGSQYEVTKELFTPIPSVCNLEFIKIITILKKLKEFNALDNFLDVIPQSAVANCVEIIKKENI